MDQIVAKSIVSTFKIVYKAGCIFLRRFLYMYYCGIIHKNVSSDIFAKIVDSIREIIYHICKILKALASSKVRERQGPRQLFETGGSRFFSDRRFVRSHKKTSFHPPPQKVWGPWTLWTRPTN